MLDGIEKERHLMLVEVVTAGKVGCRIALLEHLMESFNQMTSTTATLVGTLCKAVERFDVAYIPVGRHATTISKELYASGTTLIVGINRGIERGVVVLDVVVGSFANLVLHVPGGEGDEAVTQRAVELIGSTGKPLAASLDKVFEGNS